MAVERMAGAPLLHLMGNQAGKPVQYACFPEENVESKIPKTGKIMANQQVGLMICRGSWVYFLFFIIM